MQHYWCVNCGESGDLGKNYKIAKPCPHCEYEDIMELDDDEWINYLMKQEEMRQEEEDEVITHRGYASEDNTVRSGNEVSGMAGSHPLNIS